MKTDADRRSGVGAALVAGLQAADIAGAAVPFLLALAGGLAFYSWQRTVRSGPMIIYAICLVVGLLFTLISAVAGHFFGGHDGGDVGTGGHAEAGFDDSGVPGISFFSPMVLACFLAAFGGFGIIFSGFKATESVWASAPLSILGALSFAFVVLWVFNAVFSRAQSSSESHVATLLGQTASVISPIPENGVGEIAYVQGSTRYTAPARSEARALIAAGQTVKITRIVGTQFYVEPSN